MLLAIFVLALLPTFSLGQWTLSMCGDSTCSQGCAVINLGTSCSPSGGSSYKGVAVGGDVQVTMWSGNTCTGFSATITVQANGACQSSSPAGPSFRIVPVGGGTCFHESTTINYKGTDLTLAELEHSHPECAVPHIVHARGSIVTAKCGTETRVLRLTAGHLVYTQRGLQPASNLTKQDTLYADIAERATCTVTSVEREREVQKYFGLNCLTSHVLASGIKCSTFEKLHTIPSFWMSIMGRILGIKRASRVGDYIEQLVSKMNLI